MRYESGYFGHGGGADKRFVSSVPSRSIDSPADH